MKKRKFAGMMALLPLVLFDLTVIPVSAEVTGYEELEVGMEETKDKCLVIYKSTYEFSETIPKYPELEVSVSGYEGVYDGKPHGIIVSCKNDGITVSYSNDGRFYTAKNPVYTDVGTYVVYYKVEKDGYTATVGSATVKITEAQIKIIKDNHETVPESSTVFIKEEDVPGSSNQNNNNSNKQNVDASISKVQTGDDSHILFYGIMFIVSAFGLVKNKGRREKKEL